MGSQYLDVFLEESREHIQSLNNNLLSLEESPSKEIIDEIFRSAHTLKGMAGTMGFNQISKITHEMENLFQDIRSNKLEVTSDLIDLLLECVDIVEALVEDVATDSQESDREIKSIIEKLRQRDFSVTEAVQEVKPANKNQDEFNEYELRLIKEALDKDLSVWKIVIELDSDCLLKSARAFLVFKTMEELGDIIKTEPIVQDIEDEKFDRKFTIYLVSSSDKNTIHKSLESISELKSITIEAVEGSMLKNKPQVEKSGLKPNNVNKKKNPKATKNLKHIKRPSKTIRVDIDRLDNLMNLVSELIIIKTRLEDLDEKGDIQKRRETIEYLERITSNLHNAVMKVRMVPIENVFNRFPRVVRDLSRKLSKKISLEIEGAETELDRTIIDEIGDPLIHLIRNSADHGIESPEERRKKGKPETGTIKLKAYHDGNNVVIEVSDDGDGIDTEKILKKALDVGITDKEKSSKLSESQILSFLFEAGFSTKQEITNVSGRGVGLDVVKTKIESLGGTINVKMKRGIGTTFSISLPLTLAIIQALMVIVGNEKYAIPLSAIKETVIISSDDIKKVQKNEVILLRGNVVPIIRLKEVLDVESIEPDQKDQDEMILVIVRKGDKDVALAVTGLLGQQEIVIKSLGDYLNDIKFIAGATILGNGEVALILDASTLA